MYKQINIDEYTERKLIKNVSPISVMMIPIDTIIGKGSKVITQGDDYILKKDTSLENVFKKYGNNIYINVEK